MGYLHVKEALQHLEKQRAPSALGCWREKYLGKAHLTDEKKLA